ncbi:unnamed protein product [Paramecium pentaurelia]|uniref:Ribosomal protein S4 n=1 Tax=Paramecium pentaurelia TaxID=43138 RepID=A0A8S1XK33_9CILI|nr:unnamed protein product [Paramecium pentaurelia]
MKLKMTVLKSFLVIQLTLQEIITFQQQSPLHALGSSFSQYQFTNLFMRKFKRLTLKYKLQKNTQRYIKVLKRRSQLFAYITYTRPLNDNIQLMVIPNLFNLCMNQMDFDDIKNLLLLQMKILNLLQYFLKKRNKQIFDAISKTNVKPICTIKPDKLVIKSEFTSYKRNFPNDFIYSDPIALSSSSRIMVTTQEDSKQIITFSGNFELIYFRLDQYYIVSKTSKQSPGLPDNKIIKLDRPRPIKIIL